MPASSPRTAEIEYLVEIAKDWTMSCFASAQRSQFTLQPYRFDLTETGIRRRRVKPGSLGRFPRLTLWRTSLTPPLGHTAPSSHCSSTPARPQVR